MYSRFIKRVKSLDFVFDKRLFEICIRKEVDLKASRCSPCDPAETWESELSKPADAAESSRSSNDDYNKKPRQEPLPTIQMYLKRYLRTPPIP